MGYKFWASKTFLIFSSIEYDLEYAYLSGYANFLEASCGFTTEKSCGRGTQGGKIVQDSKMASGCTFIRLYL